MSIKYKDIKNKLQPVDPAYRDIEVAGMKISVQQYLPIDNKIGIINAILTGSFDDTTGYYSPIGLELYWSLGLLTAYAGFDFEGEGDLKDAYDLLDTNGVISAVLAAIPDEEKKYLQGALDESVRKAEVFANSAVGIVKAMNTEATGLGDQIDEILEKIKNREGIEALAAFKNVVGTD